jgi:RimJ/RimL family protein N-acetyltransferase
MTPSLAVTLVGRHATLTPLTMDDVPKLVAAATEDATTYEWTVVPETAHDMEVAVSRLLEEQEGRLGVPFVTRQSETGHVVGMTRFLSLRWWFGREFPDGAEIGGTFLSASSQRTRINTDAKLLMLGHAFDVWGVQRLDLKTDARNVRSRSAIERLGAHFDGVLRHWQPSAARGEAGVTRDSAMYSVLPSEWPGIRASLSGRLD